MISLYDGDPEHSDKLTVTYNGLSLHVSTDPVDDTYELESCSIHTNFRSIADEKAYGDGLEIYEAWKVSKALRLTGRIKAPTYAKLFDKVETLAKTFDPALVSFLNASTQGFIALDFTTLSVSGNLSCRYYARPLSSLDRTPSKFEGRSYLFDIPLICRDPRRYSQSLTTRTGNGTESNTGDYPSPATLTITMAGAGSATYTARNDATVNDQSLVLNLSGLANLDVVVVDMDARTITKNGVDTMSLYVSGNYWTSIEPGSNVIAYTNTTNATSVASYRRAWSL